MRKKIDKRGRKLIDYDKERHAIQTMQNSANRNEAKFARLVLKKLFSSSIHYFHTSLLFKKQTKIVAGRDFLTGRMDHWWPLFILSNLMVSLF